VRKYGECDNALSGCPWCPEPGVACLRGRGNPQGFWDAAAEAVRADSVEKIGTVQKDHVSKRIRRRGFVN